MSFRITARIGAERVQSLVWEQDTLVDWVAGGQRYLLDGSVNSARVNYAFPFDAACGSPSGEYAVIYQRQGTKGLVLKQGQILREINRSFYCAHAYEYPVCIARPASGREVLIHCPEEYNRLEIEDVETGQRLTSSDQRSPNDFFHSRLAVGPGGQYVLSAGWIWHPLDDVHIYDLEAALRDPTVLDTVGHRPPPSCEISSATFLDDRHVVFSTSDETFLDPEEFDNPQQVRPESIAIWDFVDARLISQAPLSEPAGTLMAVGPQHAVGFHTRPKLIDLQTAQIVARLDDVETGKQTSSIIHHIEAVPPLALDPQHRRFAVATPTEVQVVEVAV